MFKSILWQNFQWKGGCQLLSDTFKSHWGLAQKKVAHLLTVLYLPLKWFGFAYKCFERNWSAQQYYPPNANALPVNRLFAQFHAPLTRTMKEQILHEVALFTSKVQMIFAIVDMEMGMDIPTIWQFNHDGPPHTIGEYSQEAGRAGQDDVIDDKTAKYFKENSPKPGHFYTIPKIHKQGHPGHLIVSSNSYPTERISQFVDHHLQPLVTKLPSYIKDTTHIFNKLNNICQLPNGVLLVTLDVTSLYMNIYPQGRNPGLQWLSGQTDKSYYQDYKALRSCSVNLNQ